MRELGIVINYNNTLTGQLYQISIKVIDEMIFANRRD